VSESVPKLLGSVADMVTERISTKSLNSTNYISTENMLPNRGGITAPANIPDQRATLFKEEDTLFSNIRTYFRKVWFADRKGGASPDVIVFRSKDTSVCDSKFLHYLISSERFIDYTVLTAKGAKMPRGDKEAMNLFEFPEIGIDEQREIGRILKTLDDKIALNRRLNETLEGMARALFQSWFVDFDPVKAKFAAKKVLLYRQQTPSPQTPLPKGEGLIDGEHPYVTQACMAALSGKLRIPPGKPKPQTLAESAVASAKVEERLPSAEELDTAIATLDDLTPAQLENLARTAAHFPADFRESELGLVPEGWDCVALYDTAEFVNGAAFKSDDFSDDKEALPIIKIAELKQGINEQTKLTKKEVKERHRINNGDLLYSWSGSPGTSLEVFKWFGGEGWLNQHIFKINTTSKEQAVLVWLILKHLKPDLIRIAENKQTTGLGHVTVADMKRLFVTWPSRSCMETFGHIVTPIYKQHSARIQENQNLSELRDTLLPKLLSGQLLVGEASSSAEASANRFGTVEAAG
jgi:type I restriction enzyme S subunit